MTIGKYVAAAVLCWAGAVCNVAAGQDERETVAGGPAAAVEAATAEPSAVTADEEIVVRGRSPAELRFQIQLAEEAIIDRFNEINSDDRFDVVCRLEPVLGSRLDRRICRSNSWRDQDANFGQALVQQMRGETGPIPEQFLAEQQFMQRRLYDEMRRLAYEDEELRRAIERLGQTHLALAEQRGTRLPWTVSRQVTTAGSSLPFGAKLMFDVQIGRDGWSHPLTHRTFEVAHVSGKVRRLEVECDQGRERHKYGGEFAWTLPPGWSACRLRVDAKRDATFTLYEFE